MPRSLYLVSLLLALSIAANDAQAQSSTETYTYDELGRLIKVDVQGGGQNGEERVYTYDQADNRTQVVSTGSSNNQPQDPSCMLSSVGWTTLQGSFGIARLYPPTPEGCGIAVEFDAVIALESGQLTAQELDAIRASALWIGGNTIAADKDKKGFAFGPASTDVATTDPYVLRITWSSPLGNGTFYPPGYVLITVNPN